MLPRPSRHRRCFYPLLALIVCLSGCASKPIASFGGATPTFDPMKYFAGRTHSWGVFETSSGDPTSVIKTFTSGRVDADGLHFEQDLVFGGGKKWHRSWLIKRQDAHHFTATGTGIVGIAHGTAYGNVFHLDFTLDAIPGNPLGHLRMTQWLYLQSDGRTVLNRATLRKAGVIVAQLTEHFHKDS